MARVAKNPSTNAGDLRGTGSVPGPGPPPGDLPDPGTGSVPGSGRSPGGGPGGLLQCSCLGNPMDRGAWSATVHGVAKRQTRLKA